MRLLCTVVGCNYSIEHYTIYFTSSLFQVCLSITLLSPTTALCSWRVLVWVMVVLCSAQLTALPAVEVQAKLLESGSTLMEGWFLLWILLPLLLLSHSIETEALHWFVWIEDPAMVCQWCTLGSTAVKYQTKTMWSKHCAWEHISQRVQVSFYTCIHVYFYCFDTIVCITMSYVMFKM